eukprot:CAMPEP_0181214664 /NCGR_PEP_ID=MMETSP1096-20121128/25584_1 /TAXON_ID=156174 ORGANISM="Chrysochromulina ericina, Strain CCMP281" /NCGR_SAMPLE_ID=MMETSP1096 /ASSEMBLY_ACC=CAM_ASM_000453 /LENGTH=92 /DNA_ID=CAMNT_0023306435 /DNA_START=249 /DNA_END=527 /DNA_ORIENTATION=+
MNLGGVLGGLEPEEKPTFNEGDAVRVTIATTLRHVPKVGKEGFDANGLVGRVVRAYSEPSLSPNYPIKVKFEEPCVFTGHFAPDELQILPPA